MRKLPLSLILLLAAASVHAQGASQRRSRRLLQPVAARASATQAKQPAWAVPLVTTYTGLIQVVRTDIVRQTAPALTHTWNYDNSKGLNLVPWANTELAVNLPPYIQHNTTASDGSGDVSFLGKYRIERQRAARQLYAERLGVGHRFPPAATRTAQPMPASRLPSAQARASATSMCNRRLARRCPPAILPHRIGPSGDWNTVAQYRIGKLFWPEIESNATFYKGGTNDGKMQEFITPGLIIGKCGLHPPTPSRGLDWLLAGECRLRPATSTATTTASSSPPA